MNEKIDVLAERGFIEASTCPRRHPSGDLSNCFGKRIIIMGGDIERAIREVRAQGLLVDEFEHGGKHAGGRTAIRTEGRLGRDVAGRRKW
jgi:hypothetical protein